MGPNISVIIPLYNKETSIKETVESVLSQTFKDFELIIVDDGSTDNSLTVLSSFCDTRIRVMSKLNGGVADARNFGVEAALGNYIFFLDADDLISKECLSIFVKLTKKYPDEDIFVSNFEVKSTDGYTKNYCKLKTENLVTQPYKAIWKKEIFPRTGAMLYHKSVQRNPVKFNTNISVYEDLDFIFRLIQGKNIVYTPALLLTYQKEHSFLSQTKISIEKEYAYHVRLSNKPFYAKLILINMIYYSIKKHWASKNFQSIKKLIKMHFRYMPYLLISKILKITN